MKVLNQKQRNTSILRFLGINLLGLALIGLANWSIKKADTENNKTTTKQIQDQAGLIKTLNDQILNRDSLVRAYLEPWTIIDSVSREGLIKKLTAGAALKDSIRNWNKSNEVNLKSNNDSLSGIFLSSTKAWINWLETKEIFVVPLQTNEKSSKKQDPIIEMKKLMERNNVLSLQNTKLNNKIDSIKRKSNYLESYINTTAIRSWALEKNITKKEWDQLKPKINNLINEINR